MNLEEPGILPAVLVPCVDVAWVQNTDQMKKQHNHIKKIIKSKKVGYIYLLTNLNIIFKFKVKSNKTMKT